LKKRTKKLLCLVAALLRIVPAAIPTVGLRPKRLKSTNVEL
jgi:hypothetical protein